MNLTMGTEITEEMQETGVVVGKGISVLSFAFVASSLLATPMCGQGDESQQRGAQEAVEIKKTGLFQACANGDIREVISLMQDGFSLFEANEFGETPLHIAAQNGQSDLLVAIEANADMFLSDYNNELTNNYGWTPLHWAAALGNAGCVDVLFDPRSKPSTTRSGRTALHLAMLEGHLRTGQRFISLAARRYKDLKDEYGFDYIDCAARYLKTLPRSMQSNAPSIDTSDLKLQGKLDIGLEVVVWRDAPQVYRGPVLLIWSDGVAAFLSDEEAYDKKLVTEEKLRNMRVGYITALEMRVLRNEVDETGFLEIARTRPFPGWPHLLKTTVAINTSGQFTLVELFVTPEVELTLEEQRLEAAWALVSRSLLTARPIETTSLDAVLVDGRFRKLCVSRPHSVYPRRLQ